MTVDQWKEAVNATMPFPELPGVRVILDDLNKRYVLRFDSPQPAAVTALVKSHGWQWRAGAVGWVRRGTSTSARASAHYLLQALGKMEGFRA
jgi:hypothetical protein